MSIEQFEKLITNAEQSAQWWQDNKLQVNEVLRKKNIALSILKNGTCFLTLGMLIVGMCGFGMCTDFATRVSFLCLGWLMPFVVAFSSCYMETKLEMWWPKKRSQPYSGMGVYPEIFHGNDVGLGKRTNILQHIMGHSNESVRAHIPALAQLQNLDLPDAWWEMLHRYLSRIPNKKPIPKTAQQQLDEVYVEIQQHTAHQLAPKVMKL